MLKRYGPIAYSLMRFVVGFLFACHGAQKLFGVLGGQREIHDPEGLAAGIIEFTAGILISVGLFSSIAAFIASGERHPAYDALVNKFMGMITDPKQMETYSSPERIAEVVYEAATDGKDQLRYIAGADAKAIYETRMKVGDEAFRKAMVQQFFGEPKAA